MEEDKTCYGLSFGVVGLFGSFVAAIAMLVWWAIGGI